MQRNTAKGENLIQICIQQVTHSCTHVHSVYVHETSRKNTAAVPAATHQIVIHPCMALHDVSTFCVHSKQFA